MDPRNWSAKAQMAFAALVSAFATLLIVWANGKFSLGFTESQITALAASGAAVVLGIAHIDNGEPAESQTPEHPDVVLARQALEQALKKAGKS